MDLEVIMILTLSYRDMFDDDPEAIEFIASIFMGVHLTIIGAYVWYALDGISRIREDNRKIKMPDRKIFGMVISEGVELTCKQHDMNCLKWTLIDLVLQGAACYGVHLWNGKAQPLVFGAAKAVWDTMTNPLIWVHFWKERAVDHLLRPWLSYKVVTMDPDGKYFLKNKRKSVKISNEFDGHWQAKTTAKYRGLIEDHELLWYDGYVSKLEKTDDPNTVAMTFQDQDYTATIADGVLTWSDGDTWVKEGTLFDGDWYLTEGMQGPERKIARVNGDRMTWTASNIETPILVNGTKIKTMAQGGMEGDAQDGLVAWSNGMQWERARRRSKISKSAKEASQKIKDGE